MPTNPARALLAGAFLSLAALPAAAQTKSQAVASTLATDEFIDLCIRYGDSLPERASARRWTPLSTLPPSEQLAVPNVTRYFGSRYAEGWRIERSALGSSGYTIYLFSDALATVPQGRTSSCVMVIDGIPPQGPVGALEAFGATLSHPDDEKTWRVEKPYPKGWPETRAVEVAPGPPGSPLRAFLIATAPEPEERTLPMAPPDLPSAPSFSDQFGTD